MIPLILASYMAGAGLISNFTERGNDIVLHYRPGGFVITYQAQGKRWLRQHKRLVIADDQESAAADQVIWYKRKGGKVCVADSAVLLWRHCGGGMCPVSPRKYGIGRCK